MTQKIDQGLFATYQAAIVSVGKRLKNMLLIKALLGVFENNGFRQAAYMAYMALLTLFPFIIAMSALASLYGSPEIISRLMNYTFTYMPAEVAETLSPIIQEVLGTPREGVLTFAFIGTLWTASNGINILRLSLNQSFGVAEMRPYWKRRLQDIIFILAIGGFILLASLAIVLGPVLLGIADRWFHITPEMEQLWNLLRYALGAFLLLAMFTAVYHFLPNIRLPLSVILPGAGAATVLWLLLGSAFSLYLTYAGNYSLTYGSLAGILIALLFFQFSALIFLLGAEISQALHERRLSRLGKPLVTPVTESYEISRV